MKILVLGLRAFPGVQGGIETHAQHLYTRLARMGCEVEVVVRTRYARTPRRTRWRGVRFRRIWAPRAAALEAAVHTLLGVLYAAWRRPDVLHIHAVGPALWTPLARLLGLRVVVTHHGADYEREKWGRLPRWILRLGESWGMRWASERIAVSAAIRASVRRRFGVDAFLVPNGIAPADAPETIETVRAFGLEPRRYVLMVGRFVPEKRHLDLIEAFRRAALDGWKLALVGGSQGPERPDAYEQRVLEAAARNARIVCTGGLTGSALHELYAHAGAFVLPSSHEGFSITLLEALSFGLPVLASDIPANREVGLPRESYFPLGDAQALAARLRITARRQIPKRRQIELRIRLAERLDWALLAEKTLAVLRRAAGAPLPAAPAEALTQAAPAGRSLPRSRMFKSSTPSEKAMAK